MDGCSKPPAGGDKEWAVKYLGMTAQYSSEYTQASVCADSADNSSRCRTTVSDCAERYLLNVLGEFSIHYFTSHVTPEGHERIIDWVALWTSLHANLSAPDFAWDEWMTQSITFYAPELTPFLSRWSTNGIPFLGRVHFTEHDRSGLRLYSAFVQMPYSGAIAEIVSNDVSDEWLEYFAPFERAACAESLHVNKTADEMMRAWIMMGGVLQNAASSLPDLLPVRSSMPSETPGAMNRFIRQFA